MSVKMALAKLCACACGGAVIGGGAVHVAEQPRRAGINKKVAKKAVKPRRYVAPRTVKRAPRRYAAAAPRSR